MLLLLFRWRLVFGWLQGVVEIGVVLGIVDIVFGELVFLELLAFGVFVTVRWVLSGFLFFRLRFGYVAAHRVENGYEVLVWLEKQKKSI